MRCRKLSGFVRRQFDKQIADIISRDSTESRRARGTERDVNSEFSQAPFTMHLPIGKRTSLIVDPPDGRIPSLTSEAQKAKDAFAANKKARDDAWVRWKAILAKL